MKWLTWPKPSSLFFLFFFRLGWLPDAVKMFSLARRRREAERHKKLEEQFLKKDANGNGRITVEQMVQIFEENEVQGDLFIKLLLLSNSECPWIDNGYWTSLFREGRGAGNNWILDGQITKIDFLPCGRSMTDYLVFLFLFLQNPGWQMPIPPTCFRRLLSNYRFHIKFFLFSSSSSSPFCIRYTILYNFLWILLLSLRSFYAQLGLARYSNIRYLVESCLKI